MRFGFSGYGVEIAPGIAAAGIQLTLLFLGEFFVGDELFHLLLLSVYGVLGNHPAVGIQGRAAGSLLGWVFGLHPGTTIKISDLGVIVKESAEIITIERLLHNKTISGTKKRLL